MVDKIAIYNQCLEKLESQIQELQSAIDKVQESIEGEQNSTAGNKFETARAMGQEELDRLNRQMNIALQQLTIMRQIDPEKKCTSAQLGAIIQTSRKIMFLSIGLGKVNNDKPYVFAISGSSPIGQNLMGKEADDWVEFAGKREKIAAIY